VNERLAQLFDRLIAGGLSDVAGAEASITLPVSKRLLNELASAAIPVSAPVRDLDITPLDGDRFLVRGRIGPSLLPILKLNVAIDRQAEFPESPFLVLRLESTGLMVLARHVVRLITLPTWIHVEGDRIHVNLRALADQHGIGEYVSYIDHLQVRTISGTLMLSLRARVR
jgi:hypothetical protein